MRVALFSLGGLAVLLLAILGVGYLWLHSRVEHSQIEVTGGVGTSLVDPIGSPNGMDILVLGCDKQPSAGEETRSDTVMLVHADPRQNYLAVLSLPRDLRVEIPSHGIHKLNAAYSLGGWELAVETVERLTKVDITEYVEVDFQAFRDIVDALGGVYIDVDRRYYNDNPEYELIKLAPGYQLLDGDQALDYVRFRRDLNHDFGRMCRQQRFLAALREQAMGWDLVLELPGLVDALLHNVRTTLSTDEILGVANWGIRLEGSRIRQASVIGDIEIIDGVSYVIPAEGALEEAVNDFMSPPSVATNAGTVVSGTAAFSTATSAVTDTSSFVTDPNRIENSRLWKLYAAANSFPVRAPGYLPEGYAYVDRNPRDPGAYEIPVGDKVEKAIKVVYRLTREGEPTDQYLGIMETTWADAPAASNGRQVTRNGVTYTVVGTSQAVDRVWWVKDGVLYWVSNTLSYYLSSTELLKVAMSMIPVPGGVSD